MDDPRHPAGPAFEEARALEEQRRQRLIAALTPEQRKAFDELRQQQEIAAKALRDTHQQQWKDQVAERMRTNLFQDKEPHLRPDAHRNQFKDRQQLSFAIQDIVEGRATQEYSRELKQAKDKAEKDVLAAQRHERNNQREVQQRDRDSFLKQAERDRQRITPEFEKAARDPSWLRAFNRAAQQEAAHERDFERGKDHDHDKTR